MLPSAVEMFSGVVTSELTEFSDGSDIANVDTSSVREVWDKARAEEAVAYVCNSGVDWVWLVTEINNIC